MTISEDDVGKIRQSTDRKQSTHKQCCCPRGKSLWLDNFTIQYCYCFST